MKFLKTILIFSNIICALPLNRLFVRLLYSFNLFTEISNFLALIGANSSVIKFEEVRVLKETRNDINRLVNCETANLNKTINAAVKQVEAIKKLKKNKQFGKLSENLKESANLRIENPDVTYEELRKNAFKTNWKIRSKP